MRTEESVQGTLARDIQFGVAGRRKCRWFCDGVSFTIIEIRPHRGGWQCCESPGVQPYFTGGNAKEYALNYAQGRRAQRRGEIRVLASEGSVTETIPFDETLRRC